MAQRSDSPSAGSETAQSPACYLPVLIGVERNDRLAKDARLGERVAERLDLGGEIDGLAAGPQLTQGKVIKSADHVDPGVAGQGFWYLVPVGCHTQSYRRVSNILMAVSRSVIRSSMPLCGEKSTGQRMPGSRGRRGIESAETGW